MLTSDPSPADLEMEYLWYWKLARATLAHACLDYIALQFPEQAASRLRTWARHDEEYLKKVEAAYWIDKKRKTLETWFQQDGQRLADLCDAEDYIYKTFRVVRKNDSAAVSMRWER